MAHVDSYTKADSKKILKEHFRELQTYKNNVDRTKSSENKVYGNYKNADDFMLATQRRVNDIMGGRDVQKQTNVISEWVVSLPKDLNEGNEERFFDTVYEFCVNRYGKQNVIGAFVHNDESNPHIHVCFVPESISRKTNKKTVSSASLLTRKELSSFHTDLEKECTSAFGKSKLIKNGKTVANQLSMEELKQVTAREQELQQRIDYMEEYMKGIAIKQSDKTRYDLFEEWLENKLKPKNKPVQDKKPTETPVEAPKRPVEAPTGPQRQIPIVEPTEEPKTVEIVEKRPTPQKPSEVTRKCVQLVGGGTLKDEEVKAREQADKLNEQLGDFQFAQPDQTPLRGLGK